MSARILLEVCVASLEDALIAAAAGADRLELNSALELDGLTPSLDLVREVTKHVSLPVIAMIRPRPGDFCYSDRDFAVMCRDAEISLEAGAAGLAFGILTPDRRIDIERTGKLRTLCGERTPVFHRAFDRTADPFGELESLIDLGIKRVMTSGQQSAAALGSELLARLREQARNRIEILPAAGINETNVRTIVEQTGCRQVHGSFRSPATGGTDRARVRAVRIILDGLFH